jgi:hypothetical protein
MQKGKSKELLQEEGEEDAEVRLGAEHRERARGEGVRKDMEEIPSRADNKKPQDERVCEVTRKALFQKPFPQGLPEVYRYIGHFKFSFQ